MFIKQFNKEEEKKIKIYKIENKPLIIEKEMGARNTIYSTPLVPMALPTRKKWYNIFLKQHLQLQDTCEKCLVLYNNIFKKKKKNS